MVIDVAPSTGADQAPGGLCGQLHSGLDQLERELDALRAARGVTTADLGRVLREVTRLVNRCSALRDKAAGIAAEAGAPERAGARSAGHWLGQVTATDAREATRIARRAESTGLALASAAGGAEASSGGSGTGGAGSGEACGSAADLLAPGQPTPDLPAPGLAVLARAQLAGDLSPAHVDVITGTLGTLPDGLAAEVVGECEAELVRLARGRSPRDLRRLAARVLERVTGDVTAADEHEDRCVQAQEEAAWERSSFWIKDNDDGTMFGQFTVPTLAGKTLQKILEAMSAPRRRTEGDGARGATSTDDPRPWCDPSLTPKERSLARQQRHGQDLAILLEHLPTDHLHEKTAATVVVTTRLEDLTGELTRVGRTDLGTTLSAGEVRRLASAAGIIPAVLGSASVPLDLGRQSRFFTTGQRVALATLYDSCAVEGCDIPFAWCEIHHLLGWAEGGPTDLASGAPVCGHHNRLIGRGFEQTVREEQVDASPARKVITLTRCRR